jgi:hypothetical protein
VGVKAERWRLIQEPQLALSSPDTALTLLEQSLYQEQPVLRQRIAFVVDAVVADLVETARPNPVMGPLLQVRSICALLCLGLMSA